MGQGVVYLIGAGPGDPDYITVKGLKRLRLCDVVVYDYLASDRLLREVKPECRKLYVGKRAGHHSMKQEEINKLLVEEAGKGLAVVRLKGGDPFVFGRGGEEILALQEAGIAYQVIPGVTSAVAVPAGAGIPVTHRGVSRSFHVMTGHTLEESPNDLAGEANLQSGSLPEEFEAFARLSGTLIFLMGLGNLSHIVQGLLKSGKPKDIPAAVIEHGTLPGQKVVRGTLEDIERKVEETQIGTPAIIVIGQVAAYTMEDTYRAPLHHICVGLIGTSSFTRRLAMRLEDMGAETQNVLLMEVRDHLTSENMKAVYTQLETYQWIVFTSANAVRLFFQGLLDNGKDMRALGHMKFAVIGPGTGDELRKYGFLSDYMPESFHIEALAKGLTSVVGAADHLLIPRSMGGSPVLTKTLDQSGITYEDIVLYEVSPQESTMSLSDSLKNLDYLTFASASGVRSFFNALKEAKLPLPEGITLVCIGDKTAKALELCGKHPALTAAQSHIEGLLHSICHDVSQHH